MKTNFKAYASLLSAEPTDAEVIASWLRDHEADAESKTMEVDETIQESESVAAESEAYDTHLAVSQIRILSKRYTTEPDVVPFVAVIDKWDEEMWLVVPFSPYKTPATPSEMTTGLNVHGLRVLQTWNARTVQGEILKNSYLFGTLPDKVRKNALCLFRHQMFGAPIPEDFVAQRGAPIVEAADPRRDYLGECVARLEPLSRAVIELAEGTKEPHSNQSDEETNPSHEFWRQPHILAILRSDAFRTPLQQLEDEYPRIRCAAATEMNDSMSFMILAEAATTDSVKKQFAPCTLVTEFDPIYPGCEERTFVFEPPEAIKEQWRMTGNVHVVALNRDTLNVVGAGNYDPGENEIVIKTVSIKDEKDKVLNLEQLLLAMIKEKGCEHD